MGTEGLQWVWAPQWISAWASRDRDVQPSESSDARKQMWMNLNSSVVAGVGAGIGIVLAGLGTAHGLSYSFAFQMGAGVLFVLWLVMLSVDKGLLSISRDADNDGFTSPSNSDSTSSPNSARSLDVARSMSSS